MFDTVHTAMAKTGLVRDDNRWLGGVCSGLAGKLGTDVALIRILMVALLALPGSQLFVYPLLWLVMPDRRRAEALLGSSAPVAPISPVAPVVPQDRMA